MSQDLRSRAWVSEGLTYHFPEQSLPEVVNKPNIGICFSGGGTRAMTAAMGQLRALDHLGLIPKIRYISSVSGGSWASTIYTYYRKGASCDADLLGPITHAENITDSHVEQGLQPSQLAYGATKSLEEIIATWELSCLAKYSSHDVWNYAVGQIYLEDYGLFDSRTARQQSNKLPYFSYDATTVDEIKRCNPGLSDQDFLTVREDRPYLIVNSCILLPQYAANQDCLINFEYTPLTVGRPYLTTYNGNNLFCNCDSTLDDFYDFNFKKTLYGGGFIEPFAYRGGFPLAAPDPDLCRTTARPLNSTGWVTIPEPKRHYSLTETTGTSSSAFAEELEWFSVSRFNPQDFYWALQAAGPYTGENTLFGDGGLLENNGIIPLIQRGVQLAIVFINTETKLDPTYQPSQNAEDKCNDPNGRCDAYLPALFGYSHKDWKYYYPNNHVFCTSELQGVLDALNAKRERGEPMIVTCQHTVVDNCSKTAKTIAPWGVKGRGATKMSVTWCYLDRCTKWESELGSSFVQKQIKEGNHKTPTGPYEHFPNYKTINQNDIDLVQLTKQQVTLLADFTCDCILIDADQTIVKAIEAET